MDVSEWKVGKSWLGQCKGIWKLPQIHLKQFKKKKKKHNVIKQKKLGCTIFFFLPSPSPPWHNIPAKVQPNSFASPHRARLLRGVGVPWSSGRIKVKESSQDTPQGCKWRGPTCPTPTVLAFTASYCPVQWGTDGWSGTCPPHHLIYPVAAIKGLGTHG